MNDKKLSDRERALLEAARRELDAKRTGREAAPPSARARPAARPANGARAGGPGATPPLDGPTVEGWDHPAAQGGGGPDEEKWARVAALMEAERIEANEQRRRMRRFTIAFVVVALALVLLVLARMLAR
jgi:hypothetical protein